MKSRLLGVLCSGTGRKEGGTFLLYRKYHVVLKRESTDSYRAKSPAGRDAHLAEWKIAVNGTARARNKSCAVRKIEARECAKRTFVP